MRIAQALKWFAEGERIAWRSLRAGTLTKAGLRPAVGAFMRPLTAPSRYPEYEVFFERLRSAIDLDDPETWLYDVSSPKLFSILVAQRTQASVVATDIWQPAIDEAETYRGGLSVDASARFKVAVVDGRESLPQSLRPPNALFAGAFSMSVIEHVEPDPGGDEVVLRRMAEVVRRSGCVLVSVPVDRNARSEYMPGEVYGRKGTDERGAFFQRVYDSSTLRSLCERVSDVLELRSCTISEWPDHLVLQLQPKFPTAVGFAGATFPLLANRFVVSEVSRTIADVSGPGDAILEFAKL